MSCHDSVSTTLGLWVRLFRGRQSCRCDGAGRFVRVHIETHQMAHTHYGTAPQHLALCEVEARPLRLRSDASDGSMVDFDVQRYLAKRIFRS